MSDDLSLRDTATGVRLEIRVVPRASKNQVGGLRDRRLLVRVTAAPVDQAANDAVVAVVAKCLGVARRSVTIVSGLGARQKTIEIAGQTAEAVRRALVNARG